MENAPRAVLLQFAQRFQLELFPYLEEASGALGPQAGLLSETLAMTQLHRFVHRQRWGRPLEDCRALIAAFLTKSIYNLARRAN